MSFIVINTELTQKLLPMADCINMMKPAMMAASQRDTAIPPRLITPLPDGHGWLALMPGASSGLNTYGAKIVGLHPANPGKGLPAVQGFVCLFDLETGKPMGLVDGAAITAIRTAAVSALATQWLAKEDAVSCGILGTGAQAITHAEAMLTVRPLQEIVIWGRDVGKAEALCLQRSSRLASRFQCDFRAAGNAAEAAACDIVCTVTGSTDPVVKGEWVRPGAHINLVGAHSLNTREADTALIAKSKVYVDLLESTLNEGGDIMIPVQEGAIDQSDIVGELGALIAGELPGRQQADDITVYNSLGITIQDLYAAHYVMDKAKQTHVGVVID